jgi:2,3-bisphosphoglycerate-independent phosphoglycerate mutase
VNAVPQTLLIFVDGLGLGIDHPEINPIHSGACPFLESLIRDHAVPVEAGLDVPGLPQSATGQATLFTGLNAAKFMGRHVEGTPGPTLKAFVREHNLFDRFNALGYRSTFANAYYIDDMTEIQQRRRQSVSTVSALQAFGRVRTSADLLRDQAVYQDLTREVLAPRGYAGPVIAPEEAGRHLVRIAGEQEFTLFEYFQTDLMAHRGTEDDLRRVLSNLDRFLGVVAPGWERPGCLFLLTSDHGNIEDLRTRQHTHNPVPLVAIGIGAEHMKRGVRRLEDFLPVLLELYPARAPAGR